MIRENATATPETGRKKAAPVSIGAAIERTKATNMVIMALEMLTCAIIVKLQKFKNTRKVKTWQRIQQLLEMGETRFQVCVYVKMICGPQNEMEQHCTAQIKVRLALAWSTDGAAEVVEAGRVANDGCSFKV
ncbi:hypothetical protein QQP08_017787 [Theobroma cacao]|nr:hypothetical protein QQP08_017787 [Theobroma cacao]